MSSNLPEKPDRPSEFLLYQTEDGNTRIQVRLEQDTVWLTQSQMAELFQTTIPNISMHIRNIFGEGELHQNSVVKEYLITAPDGKKYNVAHYNLDVVIVGRVWHSRPGLCNCSARLPRRTNYPSEVRRAARRNSDAINGVFRPAWKPGATVVAADGGRATWKSYTKL